MSKPRLATSVLFVALAALVAVAAGQKSIDRMRVGQALQKKYEASLTGLTGQPLLQPKGGNCEADAFDFREQGYRMAGGLGGVGFARGTPPTVEPAVWPQAQAPAYANLAANLGSSSTHDVAIMVVDDFGRSPDAALGSDVFGLSSADLPSYASTPYTALDGELTRLESSGQASHGALVYAYTLALVDYLPGTVFEGFASPTGPVPHLLRQAVFVRYGADGTRHKIVVQAVDTSRYDTRVIRDAIAAALQNDADQFRIRRVAINMSFAIVPCSVKKDFERSTTDNLDAYLDALMHHGFAGTRQDLLELLLTPFPQDPLEAYFAKNKSIDAGTVVALASSGNDWLDFPYAPAAWTHVVAVGADKALTDIREGFSNRAGVRTGGAWYYVEDPVGVAGHGPRYSQDVAVAGTSFASPGAAVFTALDLALSAPCMNVPAKLYSLSRSLDNAPLAETFATCP